MVGDSSEFSSCFIEPTMGRCRGVWPLQIDTIDEPIYTCLDFRVRFFGDNENGSNDNYAHHMVILDIMVAFVLVKHDL